MEFSVAKTVPVNDIAARLLQKNAPSRSLHGTWSVADTPNSQLDRHTIDTKKDKKFEIRDAVVSSREAAGGIGKSLAEYWLK